MQKSILAFCGKPPEKDITAPRCAWLPGAIPGACNHPTPSSSSSRGLCKRTAAAAGHTLESSKPAKLSQATRRTSSSSSQLHLDAGQRDFTATRCKECGMLYARGNPTDEQLHLVHHRACLQGLSFPGFSQERVVLDLGCRRRVLLVTPHSPDTHQAKVHEVCLFVEEGMGARRGSLLAGQHWKAFMYVAGKQLLGVLVAEPIKHAWRVLPANGHQQQQQPALPTPQQCSSWQYSPHLGSLPGAAAASHAAVDLHPVWPGLLQPQAAPTRPSSRLCFMKSVLQRKAASCPADMGPPPSAGPTCSTTQSMNTSTQQAVAAAAAEAASVLVGGVADARDPAAAGGACSQRETPCKGVRLSGADISSDMVAAQQTPLVAPPAASCSSGTPTPPQGAHSMSTQAGSWQEGEAAAAVPRGSGQQQVGAGTGTGGTATPLTPSGSGCSLSVDRSKPVRAMVGVRAAWVSKEHRRQGIATQLLEAARCHMVLGYVVPRSQVAFTPPTQEGAQLAWAYAGAAQYLVYGLK